MLDQPRSSQRYEAQPRDDEGAACAAHARAWRRSVRVTAYRRIAALLRRELACEREPGVAVVAPRRAESAAETASLSGDRARRQACHVARATAKNEVWCWDFVFDRTCAGSSLKWLSILDEHTRECLALKVGRGMRAEDVIDTLAELFALRGVPHAIRSDNGPEFVSRAIQRWLQQVEVEARYVAPGSPWQNGYAESFHSRLRDEFLSREEFESLSSARRLTSAWRDDYNHVRPHSSLGYLTPTEFAARRAASVRATPSLQQHSDLPQPVPS
ncbi:MAG: IS3 family transposase [Pirellulales bacterium]